MQNLYSRKGLNLKSWRSSVVEQLTCNQQVRGSNPFASSTISGGVGEVAEWTKAADCKSAGVSLRRFESFPPHQLISDLGFQVRDLKELFIPQPSIICNPQSKKAGVAQLARASAFQAEGRGFESRLPLHYCTAGPT
jgi:hypothetical protein